MLTQPLLRLPGFYRGEASTRQFREQPRIDAHHRAENDLSTVPLMASAQQMPRDVSFVRVDQPEA